jgi:hypothetical protein
MDAAKMEELIQEVREEGRKPVNAASDDVGGGSGVL